MTSIRLTRHESLQAHRRCLTLARRFAGYATEPRDGRSHPARLDHATAAAWLNRAAGHRATITAR